MTRRKKRLIVAARIAASGLPGSRGDSLFAAELGRWIIVNLWQRAVPIVRQFTPSQLWGLALRRYPENTPSMRKLMLLSLFLSLIAALPAQEVDSVDWLDNYSEAVKVARATGKPIFLEYRCEP